MEIISSCCCCLQRPADKDLHTPYVFLGVTETFSDVLEHCFQIHFSVGINNECGICEVCVGRLRDARDFKLQVQRSQAELRARLEKAENEEELIISETSIKIDYSVIEDDTISNTEPAVKSETSDAASEGEAGSVALMESGWDSVLQPESVSSVNQELACFHFRDDQPPLTTLTSQQTLDNKPSLVAHFYDEATVTKEILDIEFENNKPDIFEFSGELLTQKTNIEKHMKAHMSQPKRSHTGEGLYNCNICEFQSRKKRSLDRHMTTHKLPLRCQICDAIFRNRKALKVHKRRHKGDTIGAVTCEICNQHFVYKSALRTHKLKHNESYACTTCGKQFKSKSYLEKHEKSVHTEEEMCEICNKKVKNLQRHELVHEKRKKHKCQFCDRTCLSLSTLRLHTKTHSSSFLYCCDKCGKQYTSKPQLDLHLLSHTGEKLVCEICQKQYTNKYKLNAHMKTHNMKIKKKRYPCNICKENFSSLKSVKRHKLIHTGERPFTCEVCNKQFRSKDKLGLHKKTHTGDKPFSCETCGKMFALKSYLKTHLQIHVNGTFSCELCSKSYSTKESLRQHKRVHNAKKVSEKQNE